ncbi:unnamed protein product [Blepharisma stoltei]|uniref:Uncharacterized protein n=1 Tax=Blepharisma stoltei TaxID=1481888 RepID=A0AAU9JE45_9CILI|nr:unnamed protein product [Blepharisma stoltei]
MSNKRLVDSALGSQAVAFNYNKLAVECMKSNNLELGLDLLQKAYKITKNLPSNSNHLLKLTTLNNLSCAYMRISSIKQAKEILNEALEVASTLSTGYKEIASTYLNISAIESSFGFHKESLAHAQKALKTLQENNENSSSTAIIAFYNIGSEQLQLGIIEGLDNLKTSYDLANSNLSPNEPLIEYIKNNYADACLKYKKVPKAEKIMPNFRIKSKTSAQNFDHLNSQKMIYKSQKTSESSSHPKIKATRAEISVAKGGSCDYSKGDDNWAMKVGSQKKLKPSPRMTEGLKKIKPKEPDGKVLKSRSGRKIRVLQKQSTSEKNSQASSEGSLIKKVESPKPEMDRITSISEKIESLKRQLCKFEEVCKPLKAMDLESLDSQASSDRIITIRDKSARIIQNSVRKWLKHISTTREHTNSLENQNLEDFRYKKEQNSLKNLIKQHERSSDVSSSDKDGETPNKTENPLFVRVNGYNSQTISNKISLKSHAKAYENLRRHKIKYDSVKPVQ